MRQPKVVELPAPPLACEVGDYLAAAMAMGQSPPHSQCRGLGGIRPNTTELVTLVSCQLWMKS